MGSINPEVIVTVCGAPTSSTASADDSSIVISNADTGITLRTYRNAVCSKNGLDFVRDEFIVGGQDGKQLLHFWHTDQDQVAKKIVCPGRVTAVCVTPDGEHVLVALGEKIYIWHTSTGNLLSILSKHYQDVTSLRCIDGGSHHFVSAGKDNLVLVWDLMQCIQEAAGDHDQTSISPVHTLTHHSMEVTSIHVGSGGNRCRMMTSSHDQTVKIYDFSSAELVASLVFDHAISCCCSDASETMVYAGSTKGDIYSVNLTHQPLQGEHHAAAQGQGKLSSLFQGHSKEITSLSVSMDGSKLLSASNDATVRVWDVLSRQCLRTTTHKSAVTNALFMRSPPYARSVPPMAVKRTIPNFKRTLASQRTQTQSDLKSLIIAAREKVSVPHNSSHNQSSTTSGDGDPSYTPVIFTDTRSDYVSRTMSDKLDDSHHYLNNCRIPGRCDGVQDSFEEALIAAAAGEHTETNQSSDDGFLSDGIKKKKKSYGDLVKRVQELESANKQLYQLVGADVIAEMKLPGKVM